MSQQSHQASKKAVSGDENPEGGEDGKSGRTVAAH